MRIERVAIVTESFLPTVNGVTTSVCRVLDHLVDTGREAMVITPRCGAPMHYRGAPVHEVPSFAYRQFPVGLPSPQVASLLARFQPDVLHAASPFMLGGQAIAEAARIGLPSVAIYQTDVAGFARRNRLGAGAAFAWQIIRRIHNAADRTLAPSTAAIADLEEAGVKRVHPWVRGVDLDGFHPDNRQGQAAAALRRRIAPHGEAVVGYVGRVAPEKGLDRLRALEGVPGIRVVIVGDGPGMAETRSRLSRLRPLFLGQLHGDALRAAYAAMDVFVHTGAEETFGQTLQEAAASGLPVVAPRAGGPIDLVDHGTTGFLFAPDDASALRRAVATLAADPAMRARMGEAGRRRVLGRSWPAVADQLVEHYEAAARRALRGAGGLVDA
ncbi:glycosyltransferase family 1 protein [Agrococcus sp. BE272]|uniref:glycosyltransferase family 4 protein n=1 Tax=Agrococcus sp. BE272 TaxID=2817727 RepID=UPI00285F8F7C|nr:glycosyltransferase family 1 protein [Agrococcus sp. BE272]MDR7235110.1 phosphatidylinositol alpha 1,6-mannosyltransferase [Agrococcus sp. BE272]